MRKFEKISFEQFKKDIKDDIDLYNEYLLPERKTKNSAGYDFFLIEDVIIKSGEIKKIPTGIKSSMMSDELLSIYIRSSLGFKFNIRLCNQVGIIDSDYYNNPSNEGHIFIALQNEGDSDVELLKSDAVVQGIFTKYLLTDNDDSNKATRMAGIGSTGGSINEKL